MSAVPAVLPARRRRLLHLADHVTAAGGHRRRRRGEPLEDWRREVFPNDLGDGIHRWSWLHEASGGSRNLLWLHRCKGGRWVTAWIDLASGRRHRLVSEDPLHIEPSIACPLGCGDHGYVRAGRWVAV